MKTRLGVLAIVSLLTACSGQDNGIKTEGWQAGNPSPTDSRTTRAVQQGLSSLTHDKARTLGNAPDKGELFTYGDKAGVRQEGAYTLRPVRLSEEHAIRGVATGLMTVPAPDGSEIRIRYERHEEHPDGNWSWIGRVIGGDVAQEAIITFGEKAVFGSIPQAAGPALRLTTKNGIAYLMQADPSKLKKGFRMGGDVKTRIPSADGSEGDNALVAMAMQKAQAGASTKSFTSGNTVDLVVGYTNGYAAANGGAAGAATRLNNLVTVANQALANSNVVARIRIVHAMQVTYADNTDNDPTLEQLTGHNGSTPVTPPASLVPLRNARDQYGADLVTLVRDFQPQNNGCGIAWLNGANGTNITPAADAPFGYSVVSDGEYDEAGNTYFCEDITLVHEIAHNMGSAHDVANAGGVPGRYPYSYGYKTTVANGNFFTVMAYGDDNQQLYRVFSNPNITSCGGRACGVANQADNARSLGQTVSIVTQFRATKVPLIGAARNDVDGDGKSDVLFANGTTREFSYRIMNGTAVTRTGLIGGVGSGYTVAGTGDFNGDSKLDVLWTSSNLDLYLWLGNGTAFSSHKVGTYPSGWKVVGVGDVDGDNRSDIIFHNATTRQVSYRIMNGTATLRSGLISGAGAGYSIAATGDFNGDGKLDLVWTSAARDLYMWTGNGNTFTSAAFGTYPAGWTIVTAGDIDADGKSDVIFYNATTRQVSYRIMNGTTTVRSGLISGAGAGYAIASTGDFNGDGKLDLVWTSAARDLYMWTGNGNTFTSAPFGNYPSGWSIVK